MKMVTTLATVTSLGNTSVGTHHWESVTICRLWDRM